MNRRMDECVRCKYSLRCLPDAHKCPECGLFCDSQMRVIRLRAKSSTRHQMIYAVFLIAIGFVSLRQLEADRKFETAIMGGVILFLGLVAWGRGQSTNTAVMLFLPMA